MIQLSDCSIADTVILLQFCGVLKLCENLVATGLYPSSYFNFILGMIYLLSLSLNLLKTWDKQCKHKLL